jgi:uncharacterized protein (TIGR04255 family)
VDQQRLDPSFEVFGVQNLVHPVRFTLGTPPPNRALFIDSQKTELLQFQSDRFVRNWRKNPGATEYPRYEALRDRFEKDFKILLEVLRSEPKINQCELTYVNHIDLGNSGDLELSDVLAPFCGTNSDTFLSAREGSQVNMRYVMRAEDVSKPIGRLHIAAEQIALPNKNLVTITLTSRGEPVGPGLAGLLSFLDLARNWIVRGFTSVTTPKMHKHWGRTQ